MDHSSPGSSVHGILQVRILQSVSMPPPGDLPHTGIQPVSPTSKAEREKPQLTSLTCYKTSPSNCFSSVQSLSHVWLFATPWITTRQPSLSITISRSSLRLTSIDSVMPSSQLILCHPLLLLPPIPPSIRVFSNESTLRMSGQSTGVAALASFLPKKSQGWSPLEWTGWISLQPKGLSRVFSNTTVQKHQFFGAQPSSQSNSHIHTWPLEKP